MSNIQFSVIIPTYNRADLILKTIQSVLDQSFSDFEIIVIDDGSTDKTQETVATIEDPRLRYFKKNNQERGAARNYGVNLAIGQFITFLDSDDIFYPNHLQIAHDYALLYPDRIFAQGFDILDSQGNCKIKFKPLKSTVVKSLVHSGNILACMGVFLPVLVAKKFPFREERGLAGSEDMELWLRLAAYHIIHHLNIPTSAIIEHDRRSVLNVNLEGLILRKELMLRYLFEDQTAAHKYTKHKAKLSSAAFTYIALHASMDHNIDKKIALKYAMQAITKYPLAITKRRMLTIARNLLFKKS